MKEQINDGGPAFPISESSSFVHAGMSLRDYFAGKAMQTLLQREETSIEKDCLTSFEVADAMIKAREAK